MIKGLPETTGVIKVHNPLAVENIYTVRHRFSRDDFFIPSSSKAPPGSRCQHRNPRRSRSSCFDNGWLSEKSAKNIQEKIDYECWDIRDMYNHLLESEKELQQDLKKVIERDDDIKKRKANVLAKKWYELTYLPLNKKILEVMNSENYKWLDKEKRNMYKNYLNHQNNTGNVYLDVFKKEEYDPLYLNIQRPGPLKATTRNLTDPLLRLQDERNEEDRVVVACNVGQRLSDKEIEATRLPSLPLIPLGRHGTKCSTWLDMELHDIGSDIRVRSQERHCGIRNKSNVCLFECKKPLKNSNFICHPNWQRKKQYPEKYMTTVKLL